MKSYEMSKIPEYNLDCKNEKRIAVISKIDNEIKRLVKNDSCYIDIAWFLNCPRMDFGDVDKVKILNLEKYYEVILFIKNTVKSFRINKLEEMTYHEYKVRQIMKGGKLNYDVIKKIIPI